MTKLKISPHWEINTLKMTSYRSTQPQIVCIVFVPPDLRSIKPNTRLVNNINPYLCGSEVAIDVRMPVFIV
ncbi:unnamed protein product [Toxocara canis]|nr:unnamed protein product [Toxocara canis]